LLLGVSHLLLLFTTVTCNYSRIYNSVLQKFTEKKSKEGTCIEAKSLYVVTLIELAFQQYCNSRYNPPPPLGLLLRNSSESPVPRKSSIELQIPGILHLNGLHIMSRSGRVAVMHVLDVCGICAALVQQCTGVLQRSGRAWVTAT
jgi:hypothetical protein